MALAAPALEVGCVSGRGCRQSRRPRPVHIRAPWPPAMAEGLREGLLISQCETGRWGKACSRLSPAAQALGERNPGLEPHMDWGRCWAELEGEGAPLWSRFWAPPGSRRRAERAAPSGGQQRTAALAPLGGAVRWGRTWARRNAAAFCNLSLLRLSVLKPREGTSELFFLLFCTSSFWPWHH